MSHVEDNYQRTNPQAIAAKAARVAALPVKVRETKAQITTRFRRYLTEAKAKARGK